MKYSRGLESKNTVNQKKLKNCGYDIHPHSTKPDTMQSPPDGLPTYRILTGVDDAAFCRRVSDAIALGYKLYGSPSATFNGQSVIVAQAIIWASIEPTSE